MAEMKLYEALLYEKLPESFVRCNTCQWRCRIAPEKEGVCRRYANHGGRLYNLNYGRASSVAVDPIEKKPLYHFYPGSLVFSLGSWGCNFHCPGCQNWTIACATQEDMDADKREISPEASIQMAQGYKCQGIAWTYNEPTMWFEYTLDSARLARAAGLYTAYVTNGYMTPEALDIIGPYLQAWRVDVKGFSEATYKKLAKITHWRGILEVASRARNKWNMHVEIVTNVTPGINDDDGQLKGIAHWIATELGELTPWHITRFFPQREMRDFLATPVTTLEHARDIGHQAGLKFVYLGNVGPHETSNTICYNCHNLIVRRDGFHADVLGLKGSNCNFCGVDLNFRV
jgi:pyruvate formate lyase activating enzyme